MSLGDLEPILDLLTSKQRFMHRIRCSPVSSWRQSLDDLYERLSACPPIHQSAALLILIEVTLEICRLAGDTSGLPERCFTDLSAAAIPLADLCHRLRSRAHGLLATLTDAGEPSRLSLARRALLFIDHEWREPLTGSQIATALGTSRPYLNTVFKQVVGTTLHSHLDSVRVARAARLVEAGWKIEAAALCCGFRNKPTFYRAFKRHINALPSELRNRGAARVRDDRSGPRSDGTG